MHILLIHGQGRTSFSMSMLGLRLIKAGHKVHYFGYLPWTETFDQITQRLIARIETTIQRQPYVLIGHSLGSILARASLPSLGAHPPRHLIMLGPPNQSPLLARRLKENPLYRLLTDDCGSKLATPEFYEELPLPTIPTTIIAGTAGPRGRWSPFGYELNDGVVTVAETQLNAPVEVILTPAIHTFIMNSRATFEAIKRVLDGEAR